MESNPKIAFDGKWEIERILPLIESLNEATKKKSFIYARISFATWIPKLQVVIESTTIKTGGGAR